MRMLLAVLSACVLASCGGGGGGDAGGSGSTPPPYAVALETDAIGIPQGSSGRLLVNVTRQAGFTDDVSVTLDSPPAGLHAGAMTVPPTRTQGTLEIQVDPDAQLQASTVRVLAQSGSSSVAVTATVTVSAAVPGSQDLIAQALEAAQIDYPTSLVYRAYALFGDSRLPPAYQSAGPIYEDRGLFVDAADPSLPAATQDLLRPFLVRPAHADSIFNQSGGAAPQRARRAAAGTTGSPCPDGTVATATNWRSEASLKAPFQVWIQCSTDPAADDYDLAKAVALIDGIWKDMTKLMGPPVPDAGGPDEGGDPDIDFYLVGSGEVFTRGGGSQKLADPNVLAYELSSPPFNNNTSSGFLVLDRGHLYEAAFKSELVHEFFHALQEAYNQTIAFTSGPNGSGEYWYTEASAVWAQTDFARETSGSEVHTKLFPRIYQKIRSPLHLSGKGLSLYASYIFPFFMQQKTGGDAIVQQSWAKLRGVNGFDAGNQALNTVFDFTTNFHLFAIENYNTDLPGVLDEGKRYIALDSKFPDNVTPTLAEDQPLSQKVKLTPTVDIAALRAAYYRYKVTSDQIKKVIFTFDEISKDGLDIDGLVEIEGQQNWQKNDYTGRTEVKFCLDKPEEKLHQIVLVLSNHNVPLTQVTGKLKVQASTVPCGGSFSGSADSTFGPYTMHAEVSYDIDDTRSTDAQGVYLPSGTVSFTADASTGCVVTPGSQDIQPSEGQLVIDFTQNPPTYKVQGITVWAGTYHCNGGSIQAGAGGIWLGDTSSAGGAASGTVTENGTLVQGSNAPPGYTFSWKLKRE
jgi:hypothetical protein